MSAAATDLVGSSSARTQSSNTQCSTLQYLNVQVSGTWHLPVSQGLDSAHTQTVQLQHRGMLFQVHVQLLKTECCTSQRANNA